MDGDVIVMFELTLDGDDVSIVREKHFRLVGASDITPADLGVYKLPDKWRPIGSRAGRLNTVWPRDRKTAPRLSWRSGRNSSIV